MNHYHSKVITFFEGGTMNRFVVIFFTLALALASAINSPDAPISTEADPECPSTLFNPYICAAFNGVGSWVIPSGTGSNNGGGNNHLVALSVRL